MRYLVATIKKWNIDNYRLFKKTDKKNTYFLIKDKKSLAYAKIKKINPRFIFFPHWSWIIPKEIWSNFNCVVFHMTDLPYGRGGTPLQNLILRGYKKTKISALKVDGGLDTGDVYLKKNLSLAGSAEEIYQRASKIIFNKMIPEIIKKQPISVKQTGKVVKFFRRKPEQSRLGNNLSLDKMYDYIRMLDAEGYPRAFMETQKLKIEFFQVKLKNKKLIVKAEIYAK